MKTVKEYKLYVFHFGAYDRRKCVLVDDNFGYMIENMRDTAERIYHDYFEHSDCPLMQFLLVEVYDDGYEAPLEAGSIQFGKYKHWPV